LSSPSFPSLTTYFPDLHSVPSALRPLYLLVAIPPIFSSANSVVKTSPALMPLVLVSSYTFDFPCFVNDKPPPPPTTTPPPSVSQAAACLFVFPSPRVKPHSSRTTQTRSLLPFPRHVVPFISDSDDSVSGRLRKVLLSHSQFLSFISARHTSSVEVISLIV